MSKPQQKQKIIMRDELQKHNKKTICNEISPFQESRMFRWIKCKFDLL